ncbi:Predicted acyltransferase [Parapedobacter composti]|uniref:Predicted acyltransferase n=1 Tax=Parapedobacter composti TaxID=623281 RepID=A0A1I1E6A7_9SPHI|nr:heparan-alpha-glucosaminide N-acetyltransferase domain-containing protein [Parapedobacter composti]SFB82755.1 Predicted acyltransferase [Parapedobacter composti]
MNKRYYSLDVFRGATVALMILVNNPGSWAHLFSPLKHADWHGCTPTDLVFPFFLFAVGNAMAFVMPRLRESGDAVFWKKVLKRTLLIFGIGLLLNWWPFVQWRGETLVFKLWVDPDNPDRGIRIMGVLQRIALAYCFASILVYYFKERWVIIVSALLLLGYWALCVVFGAADPYSLAGWFGTAVDKHVLGVAHLYKGEGVPFDPEGLVSTLPAIVQVVLGYLTGRYIREQGRVEWLWPRHWSSGEPIYPMLGGLFVVAVLMTLLGLFWGLAFPINKKIWTGSYVLYTTGLAMLAIGTMIWFIEVLKVRNGLTRFFDVFGKNPLFIFVLSGALPRLLGLVRIPAGVDAAGENRYTTPLRWFYTEICAKVPGPPEVGSFCYALAFLGLCWAICYMLDKKGIYIKV